MKFEEILPALRAGKKVMSYSIDCEYMYYSPEDGELYTDKGCKITLLTSYVMKLDDWEIVKNKKVKLRDLTEKQFTKWVKNYCTYNGTYCGDCPFKSVNCVSLNNPYWSEYKDNCRIKHKDLFSDKFLDQEIEIEEE